MSEIEKINTYNVAFQEALREDDGDKCASMCAEDAVMMLPNAPPVEGRDATSDTLPISGRTRR